jgi:hypothetical protein
MLQLQAMHDRVGRPHCVLINQAHSFLRETSMATPRLAEITMIYATSEPQLLPQPLLHGVRLIVAAGEPSETPPFLAQSLLGMTAEPAQATTAGGACRMSVFRPASSGRERASSDAAAASGY